LSQVGVKYKETKTIKEKNATTMCGLGYANSNDQVRFFLLGIYFFWKKKIFSYWYTSFPCKIDKKAKKVDIMVNCNVKN